MQLQSLHQLLSAVSPKQAMLDICKQLLTEPLSAYNATYNALLQDLEGLSLSGVVLLMIKNQCACAL